MANYIFRTPTVDEAPIGKHRLFYFFKKNAALSVKKVNGVYSKVRYEVDADTQGYQEFYIGGHDHIVSDTTKSALISANIGIDETNFTAI